MLCQTKTGTAVEHQHALSQSEGHINTTWVLLDNQSIVGVFSNRHLLKNIRKSDRALAIFSTGGRTTIDLQGELMGYGTVWFHLGGISNILSLSKVEKILGVLQQHWIKQVPSLPSRIKHQIFYTMRKGSLLFQHGRRGDGTFQYCTL